MLPNNPLNDVHDQSETLARWRAEHRRYWLRPLPPAALVAVAWLLGLAAGVLLVAALK